MTLSSTLCIAFMIFSARIFCVSVQLGHLIAVATSLGTCVTENNTMCNDKHKFKFKQNTQSISI